jgi:uncharacterized protein (TIGR03086 family)
MNGPADMWQQAADNFDRHYRSIDDAQWTASTPCAEWSVRELVDHTVQSQAALAGALGVDVGVGEAVAAADWPTVQAAFADALAEPTLLEGDPDPDVFGGMPKHQLMGLAIGDLLIHGWDLARALGADESLPPEVVETVHLGLQRIPDEQMRGAAFGPEVEVPSDASAQDKLLAFTGRRP